MAQGRWGKRILVYRKGEFIGCYVGFEEAMRMTNLSEWMIRKRIEDGKETKDGYTFDIPFSK